MTQWMLCVLEYSENGVTNRLWPISEEFATRVITDMGEPASEALADMDAVQNLHQTADESGGVVYLDQSADGCHGGAH